MPETEASDWRTELAASTVDGRPTDSEEGDGPLLGLTILSHPDPGRVGETAPLIELLSGREASLSRIEPLFAHPHPASRRTDAKPLIDSHLSRNPIRIVAGKGDGDLRVVPPEEGRKRGAAAKIAGEPLYGDREIDAEEVARGVVLLMADRVALLIHQLDPSGRPARSLPEMVGESRALNDTKRAIARVAELDMPVLIEGQTGSGKELVARAIHRASPRRERPLVAVNMASVPPSLAAAELFGTRKGAFTGADRERRGYFGQADGGTLFLDEIGETPAEVQALLLRAIETGEIRAVGADRDRSVDVRILAATDADLDCAIDAGRFRAPLFHRLSGAVVRVPPLHERPDDIGRLLHHFLRRELEACGRPDCLAPARRNQQPWLPAALVARLAAHPWPGNVRQLRNVARHLVIAHRDAPRAPKQPEDDRQLLRLLGPGSPMPDASEAEPSKPVRSATTTGQGGRRRHRQPSQITETELAEALRQHRWRFEPAARELGISRTSLYALVDRSPNLRRAGELGRREIEAVLDAVNGDLHAAVDRLRISEPALLQRMRELDLR